jgi:putative SOS response-associated peptidase YedK
MCYRYSVPGPDTLVKRFDASFVEQTTFSRHYHASSFDLPKLPVITSENPKQIQLYCWGLIPFWVKDEKAAEELRFKTMNARAEELFEKPSFRDAAQKKHCLVLADGFFEWQEVKGKNYPYYIRLKSREPFALAGLWDRWTNRTTGETISSYTVITTKANPLLEQIHNKKQRMPVILTREDEQEWLRCVLDKDHAKSFLVPYDHRKMEAYTISRLITSKAQDPDTPAVLEPFAYPELQPTVKQKKLV